MSSGRVVAVSDSSFITHHPLSTITGTFLRWAVNDFDGLSMALTAAAGGEEKGEYVRPVFPQIAPAMTR